VCLLMGAIIEATQECIIQVNIFVGGKSLFS